MLIILHGDDATLVGREVAGKTFWRDGRHKCWCCAGEWPAGDYVLASLDDGPVGNGFYGLAHVELLAFSLPQAAAAGEGARPPGALDDAQLRELDRLTPRQGAAVVDVLTRDKDRAWVWNNATEEARRKLSAGFGATPKEAAYLLYREGVALFDRGERHAGMDKLGQSIALDPSAARTRSKLGQMAIDVGDVVLAIRYFMAELQTATDPDAWTAHAYLAAIYRELGQMNLAQMHALAAIAANPSAGLAGSAVDRVRRAVRSSLGSDTTGVGQAPARRGLCAACGRPLGVWDRLRGRARHRGCGHSSV